MRQRDRCGAVAPEARAAGSASHRAAGPADDPHGPGLLASRAFWGGAVLSVLCWVGVIQVLRAALA